MVKSAILFVTLLLRRSFLQVHALLTTSCLIPACLRGNATANIWIYSTINITAFFPSPGTRLCAVLSTAVGARFRCRSWQITSTYRRLCVCRYYVTNIFYRVQIRGSITSMTNALVRRIYISVRNKTREIVVFLCNINTRDIQVKSRFILCQKRPDLRW